MSTSLYRFYGLDDELLYVGIARNPVGRMGQHAADKPWWQMVSRATIEHYGSRSEARVAEQAAIDAGSPRFNQIRAQDETPMRSFRCDDERWEKVKARAEALDVSLTAVMLEAIDLLPGGADRSTLVHSDSA